jgi:hypothetical protein
LKANYGEKECGDKSECDFVKESEVGEENGENASDDVTCNWQESVSGESYGAKETLCDAKNGDSPWTVSMNVDSNVC